MAPPGELLHGQDREAQGARQILGVWLVKDHLVSLALLHLSNAATTLP